jgi:hypothetical protein
MKRALVQSPERFEMSLLVANSNPAIFHFRLNHYILGDERVGGMVIRVGAEIGTTCLFWIIEIATRRARG